jgi:4-aminobutyrate aminotransferase-like enzyme
MIGIPLIEPGTDGQPLRAERVFQIHTRLVAAGLLLHPVAASVLAVLPPLTITEEESTAMLAILGDVLEFVNRRHTRRG